MEVRIDLPMNHIVKGPIGIAAGAMFGLSIAASIPGTSGRATAGLLRLASLMTSFHRLSLCFENRY